MSAHNTSAYETARAANIKRNQALLAELNLKSSNAPLLSRSTRATKDPRTTDGPPSKKRKTLSQMPPQRTSARIAASDRPRPVYTDTEVTIAAAQARSAPSLAGSIRRGGSKRSNRGRTNVVKSEPGEDVKESEDESENSYSSPTDVATLREKWRSWEPTAAPPTRDGEGTIHFEDELTFLPNKTPAEMIREGSFGGSYWRPIRSRKLGFVIEGDWEELPQDWIEGLDVGTFLTSSEYDPEINKYKVACGQSIEEWEASGWIDHEHDVRGWFQWYTRFYQGRRCDDDQRQISRWRKCVGETGRWRRTLLKKYVQAGVRTVWDDGEDEDAPEVSPVIHQTCHHWAFEVRQETLDAFWAGN